MASDPTGSQPKGVLTRPATDFFDDHLGCGLAEISTNDQNNTWFSVSLFNNSSQGRVFKVYGLSCNVIVGGGLVYFFIYGHVGTLQGPCSPLRPDVGMPYGQIYSQFQDPAVGTINPFITGTVIGALGSAGESYTLVSPYPLFIVPSGWSLVGCNPRVTFSNSSDQLKGYAGFWYQVCDE